MAADHVYREDTPEGEEGQDTTDKKNGKEGA